MGLKGCIFTKLDEATSLGDALSVTIRHRLPLAFISDGQRVPEDLHFPRVMNLLTQAMYLAQRFKEGRDDESPIWPLRVTRTEEVSVSA
jgi:flagellar biosynthesis protein FlhF